MRNVLVLGSGQSAGFLIHRLLQDAKAPDWFVTVGELDVELAAKAIGDHPRGAAIHFDVTDPEMTSAQIERDDLVVNMLPQRFQSSLAWTCLQHGRHLVSVSYRDRDLTAMHHDVQRKGVLFLTEVGLDPGIDLMSAAQIQHGVHRKGGHLEVFESYGSGVPEPDGEPNPLNYVITWNPRNVAMAGEQGAQWLEEGRVRILPWHKIFQYPWPLDVPGFGKMEAYPNRDSLGYRELLGLKHAHTIIRGTLRFPGFCETWAQIVELGLPNEQLVIPELAERSWAEIVGTFIPPSVSGTDLEARVANYLRISRTGRIMDNLRWLGLFSEEPLGIEGLTAADALIHLLRTRLPLPPQMRDTVILYHDFVARYEDARRERIRSTLVAHGDAGGYTAMSRTVGLPAAVAVRAILDGSLPLTGCYIPTHPAIYETILAELGKEGLEFRETTEELS